MSTSAHNNTDNEDNQTSEENSDEEYVYITHNKNLMR